MHRSSLQDHLLIVHLRHWGCVIAFIYPLLWGTACVPSPGYLQEHQKFSMSIPFFFFFWHQFLPDLKLCLQNECWFFLSLFQAAFACFLLLEQLLYPVPWERLGFSVCRLRMLLSLPSLILWVCSCCWRSFTDVSGWTHSPGLGFRTYSHTC